MVDLIAQNDGLRALDIALQRVKAIEIFISQGHWSQASLIELILPEGEQRAWFRQELKAVQQEYKAEQRLSQDQWARKKPVWNPSAPATGGGGEKKNPEDKDGTPPVNTGGPSPGRRGKGKGKKGKRW